MWGSDRNEEGSAGDSAGMLLAFLRSGSVAAARRSRVRVILPHLTTGGTGVRACSSGQRGRQGTFWRARWGELGGCRGWIGESGAAAGGDRGYARPPVVCWTCRRSCAHGDALPHGPSQQPPGRNSGQTGRGAEGGGEGGAPDGAAAGGAAGAGGAQQARAARPGQLVLQRLLVRAGALRHQRERIPRPLVHSPRPGGFAPGGVRERGASRAPRRRPSGGVPLRRSSDGHPVACGPRHPRDQSRETDEPGAHALSGAAQVLASIRELSAPSNERRV